MILSEIQQQLYDRLGFEPTPPTDVSRRLLGYLNEVQSEMVTMRGLWKLKRVQQLPFACRAADSYVVLPQAVTRIAGITCRTLSQRSLVEISAQELNFRDPGRTSIGGVPSRYRVVNMTSSVAIIPASGTQLYMKSTSAGDVQVARLRYISTLGVPLETTVTLTGVTQAAFPVTDVDTVTSLTLASVAVGTVSLINTGATITYAQIGRGHTYGRYTLLELWPQPSAATTFYLDGDMFIPRLLNADDVPFLPEDWHWLYVVGAVKKDLIKRKDWGGVTIEESSWKRGVADLKAYCQAVTDDGVGRLSLPQTNQLGPMYPAGT